MAIRGKDSLLDTAGVLLTAHTPSGTGATGGPWVKAVDNSYGAPVAVSGGGYRGQALTAGTSWMDGSAVTDPDYAQADVVFSADGYGGVILGQDTHGAGGNGGSNYCFTRYPSTGRWIIGKDGGGTILASDNTAFATATNYTMRLERSISGGVATLKCYLNGVEIVGLRVTDSTYLSTMRGGLLVYDNKATFSNFESGGTPPPVAAGTLTETQRRSNGASFSLATNTNGTAPYSNQLQRSPAGAGTWSNVGSPVSGATATLSDTSAAANTSYDYRVVVTDADTNTANSNTVSLVTCIAPTDSKFNYYGRWGGTNPKITINCGAECEFVYTGNSCKLSFDTSTVAGGRYPVIAYWIDNVGPTRATLTSTGLVTITPALNAVTAGRHRVRFMAVVYSGYPDAVDNWNNQTDAVKFLGVSLAAANDLKTLPYNPNQIEFLGDSITASLAVTYAGTYSTATDNPEIGWPEHASQLLGLRAIVNGHGGQSLVGAATDGTPAANAAFPYSYNGVAYTPTYAPVAVVIYHGTNATASQAQWETFLGTIRSAYPDALIFAVNPYNVNNYTAISGAVTALADSLMFALDYRTAFVSTDNGPDNVHFNETGAVDMAAKLATDVQAQFDSLSLKMQVASSGVLNVFQSPLIRAA